MFECKSWHKKTETKNVKVAKIWWNLSKPVTNTPPDLILVIFFRSIILSLFAGEKYILRKRFSEGMGNLVLFLGNDKNLGESFVWGH